MIQKQNNKYFIFLLLTHQLFEIHQDEKIFENAE